MVVNHWLVLENYTFKPQSNWPGANDVINIVEYMMWLTWVHLRKKINKNISATQKFSSNMQVQQKLQKSFTCNYG